MARYVAFVQNGYWCGFTSLTNWYNLPTDCKHDIDQIVEFEGPAYPEPTENNREVVEIIFNTLKNLSKDAVANSDLRLATLSAKDSLKRLGISVFIHLKRKLRREHMYD